MDLKHTKETMSSLDIVISFDDTGSMSSVRRQVRSQIQSLVDQLFKIIPNLRIGIIIHNDYCDRDLVQRLELTSDKQNIIDFVNRGSSMGGGDHREAYAYVLNEMLSFEWNSDQKLVVMIGDAPPHEQGSMSKSYQGGYVTEKYDWKEISAKLGESSIPIYAIQALGDRGSTYFYQGMAKLSNGIKLDLSQFGHITDYLLAILNKVNNTLDDFQGSKPEFTKNLAFKSMFAKLRGDVETESIREFDLKSEKLGKFQVIDVPHKIKIKAFVEDMGLRYRAGRGFYQFVSSEKIQANKEVLFVDKDTGETFMDTKWCREQMGLPFGTAGTLSPKKIPSVSKKYDIFIQSNSYTRDLDPGTKFLYELDKH